MKQNSVFLDIAIDPIECAVETIATLNMASSSERETLRVDLPKLSIALKDHVSAIKNGDLQQVEATLYSQALVLQDYFCRVIKMASLAKNINHMQMLGQLALKAQNQCRTTLSTLAEIKHPKRATFIKQQNNAFNQQVNNNLRSDNSKKIDARENELLKEPRHEALDSRRSSTAISINPQLETVGKIDRC